MRAHLQAAAARRRHDAEQRADHALLAMSREGATINFVAVARRARVSTDFLYRHPSLRRRIIDLRVLVGPADAKKHSAVEPNPPASETSSAVRALSTQLKETRARCREEVARLQAALAAAHGENLRLRRALGQAE
ncbi:MAG: DUF6262 family protein [Dehalococcoidia bacterium]